MKKLLFFALAMALSTVLLAEDLLDVRDTPNTPIKIIFDTDMGNDFDDALALSILHAMSDRGKCELVGVTITKCHPMAAEYVKAFNTLYGRPDIPVGLVKDGPEQFEGRYLGKAFEKAGVERPKDFVPEDSVVLLRKLLAKAEDNSIVIVQVGFSTNLARLLDTPADDISPLTGYELAAKKVRLVSAMAGSFAVQGKSFWDHLEYNVIRDIPAAKKVFEEWPGEIVFSGFEVGASIHIRSCTLLNDYEQPRKRFLKESALLYMEGRELRQPTWDLTSVLFVVRPEDGRNYYTVSQRGNVTVRENGKTDFAPDANGKRRYFICTYDQNVRVEEAFVNLCSE